MPFWPANRKHGVAFLSELETRGAGFLLFVSKTLFNPIIDEKRFNPSLNDSMYFVYLVFPSTTKNRLCLHQLLEVRRFVSSGEMRDSSRTCRGPIFLLFLNLSCSAVNENGEVGTDAFCHESVKGFTIPRSILCHIPMHRDEASTTVTGTIVRSCSAGMISSMLCPDCHNCEEL